MLVTGLLASRSGAFVRRAPARHGAVSTGLSQRMVIVVPDVAGHAVERYFVVPSPIRTLSVLTLLAAVTGSVILTHQGRASTTDASALPGPAEISGAAFRPGGAMIARTTQQQVSRSRARTPLPASGVLASLPSGPGPASPVIDFPAAAAAEARQLRAYRADDVAVAVLERSERARRRAAEAERRAEAKAQRARQARAAVRASRSARSDPKALARIMLADRGWSGQFGCLDSLWRKESRWNYQANNPSSGAYGIPQALPGSKMASAGADWRTNPATQMKWGLGYIKSRYGTPCGAWSHSQGTGWY